LSFVSNPILTAKDATPSEGFTATIEISLFISSGQTETQTY